MLAHSNTSSSQWLREDSTASRSSHSSREINTVRLARTHATKIVCEWQQHTIQSIHINYIIIRNSNNLTSKVLHTVKHSTAIRGLSKLNKDRIQTEELKDVNHVLALTVILQINFAVIKSVILLQQNTWILLYINICDSSCTNNYYPEIIWL